MRIENFKRRRKHLLCVLFLRQSFPLLLPDSKEKVIWLGKTPKNGQKADNQCKVRLKKCPIQERLSISIWREYKLFMTFIIMNIFLLEKRISNKNFEGNYTNNRNSNTKLNDLVASIPFAMFSSSISSFNRAQSAWSWQCWWLSQSLLDISPYYKTSM